MTYTEVNLIDNVDAYFLRGCFSLSSRCACSCWTLRISVSCFKTYVVSLEARVLPFHHLHVRVKSSEVKTANTGH